MEKLGKQLLHDLPEGAFPMRMLPHDPFSFKLHVETKPKCVSVSFFHFVYDVAAHWIYTKNSVTRFIKCQLTPPKEIVIVS